MAHWLNFGHTSLTYNDVQVVPAYSNIESRKNISTRTRLVGEVYIDHPLIPANMDTISSVDMVNAANKNGGICFFHRFYDTNQMIENIGKVIYNTLGTIGISVGVQSYDKTYANIMYDHIRLLGGDNVNIVFLIDVAHGHHKLVAEMVSHLKTHHPDAYVIAGNIATGEAAHFLIGAGVDGLKVGVGPGSLCSTRIQTGAGVPQFTAVLEVAAAIENTSSDATLIADGGIKYSGDIVKAIGAGADSVMSGYLFAGTDATPGVVETTINGPSMKVYRGSASRESKMDRGESNFVEGVATRIPFKGNGSTDMVFKDTLDGIRSGLSYAGFDNLMDSVGNMWFTKISNSSIIEAHPNGGN